MQNFKLMVGLAIASVPLLLIGAAHTRATLQNQPPVTQPPVTQTPVTQTPPAPLLAQQSRVRRVQFAPGAVSATVEDAVVRGTRTIYLVGANKGQTLTVNIASLENNAVFELKAPANKAGQRRTLKPEAVSWTGKLPETGDYQVIVGGTRGNASYKLSVKIK